ncbi:MAG: TA system VapC family ribonuclease toxin [Deltaproteobacteria bacterium]|nr:TA system VapC family ribonuclease toxin [Deltaproteobacteria bacterium]
MILVDANLLLYATISDFEQHAAARDWLDARLNAPARVGLPWPSLLAFVRISTNARVFPRPLAVSVAWRRVTTWLDLPNVWTPEPTERHRELLDAFLTGPAGSSKLVSDAHLAAIAVSHGLLLCSTDGDFARFRPLRWENPLAG